MEITKVVDLKEAYLLIRQLRTHLAEKDFLEILKTAEQESSYELLGAYKEEKLLGLMGYRVLSDFVHGRHIYIDDLVIDADHRSQGLGAIFLKKAQDIAKENGCSGLRLCTGMDNPKAQIFYERNGLQKKAVVYKMKLTSSTS